MIHIGGLSLHFSNDCSPGLLIQYGTKSIKRIFSISMQFDAGVCMLVVLAVIKRISLSAPGHSISVQRFKKFIRRGSSYLSGNDFQVISAARRSPE